MLREKTVSLVIVDTESYRLARSAVDKTIGIFPVDDVLVFSDNENFWHGFKHIKINKITSTADYNRILLGQLPHYLETDFALVIQYDGFAINPTSFSDFFFKFDYIGATWPAGYIKNQGPIVGNGGFSLRSKRLVDAVLKYGDVIDINFSEDAMICRFVRPLIEEREGICFAPVEVARHFSIEFEDQKNCSPFGFHGLHFLPLIYKDDLNFLLDNLPQRCLIEDSYQLNNLKMGFKNLGNAASDLLQQHIIKSNSVKI